MTTPEPLDLKPCPFCPGEVRRQPHHPDSMLHVGTKDCLFGFSGYSVEKWNRRVSAPSLPAPLEWTRQAPQAPGWYWCRNDISKPVIENIKKNHGNGDLYATFMGRNLSVADGSGCEWAGPIPPPKEQSPEVQK